MISESPLIAAFLNDPAIIFRIGFIIFAVLYFIFSLIVIRQVNMMTKTVMTEGGGTLRFLSFVFALMALGVIVFFVILL